LDAWNPFINLTRIESASERASRHLLDALVAVPLIDQLAPGDGAFADLGSGGGFPGIPLAARLLDARPRATFDLI
jgi:16S rRNA (guanine527-N7)-methyltransferase